MDTILLCSDCQSDDFEEINIWWMRSGVTEIHYDGKRPAEEIANGGYEVLYTGDTEWGESLAIECWLCRRCDKVIKGPEWGIEKLLTGKGRIHLTAFQLLDLAGAVQRGDEPTISLCGMEVTITQDPNG